MLQLKCKICGTIHEGTTYEAKEMMFGLGESFSYFQCAICDCLQICETPNDLPKYYPQDYYSFAPYDGRRFNGLKGKFYKLRVRSTLFDKSFSEQLINRINPVSKLKIFKGLISTQSRILDVGCGNGDMFLYPLKEAGIENAVGCDPFIPYDITYSNGLKIFKADIFQMKDKWDIIIYNHSFEHVHNPLENLQRVSELLNPKGVCILRIPTVPNYAWDQYKTNWAQLDAPRHLFLYSPKSIKYLAGKSGLILNKIIYDSTFFQFSGSEAIARGIPLLSMKKHQGTFLKRKLERWKFEKLAKKMNAANQGDQATFYLIKN